MASAFASAPLSGDPLFVSDFANFRTPHILIEVSRHHELKKMKKTLKSASHHHRSGTLHDKAHNEMGKKRIEPGMSRSGKGPELKIIPLGGCEEVGRNMTVFEYGDDIVILDMGVQFPEEDMPGVDYVIPNISYLRGKERNIKGVIFSHGHLDHIGAAPILLEQLGNPTIIGREMTLALVKSRQEDYKKGTANKLRVITVKSLKDVIKLGRFTVKFFQIEHSIVDAVGVILETPSGTVIHPGDWTMERDEQGKAKLDYRHLRQLPRPTVLMLESLGATRTERSPSSQEVYRNLHNIISRAPGRIIIGTFSSQIERIEWVIETAQKLGKKVALDGFSMKKNIEIAKQLGYIKLKENALIDIKNINDHPDKKVIVICTGAQGEKNAVLFRIVDKVHRFVQLKKSDTVIFSSSVIPGNERMIQRLKDNIYRQSDHVIHSEIMDVHVSGHANRQDIAEILEMVQPSYFMPVYANHYFLKEAANLAIERGFARDKIFVPDNGSVIVVNKGGAKMLDRKVPSNYVYVDGLGVSDMQNIVLRDRQVLAEDGIVVLIVTVDTKTGKLAQSPDIISRGFVYLKEQQPLVEQMRASVKSIVLRSAPKTWADTTQVKGQLRDRIGQFLFTKTQKRPMVIPVVIEV
jgi:ribonuclease J